jgi:hypothetical protein
MRLLTDPDEAELARMIDVGERVTWPKVRFPLTRYDIRLTIPSSASYDRESFPSGKADSCWTASRAKAAQTWTEGANWCYFGCLTQQTATRTRDAYVYGY